MSRERLIVVSNRLPITVKESQTGFRIQPSGGGLVSALAPILNESGGCWVGWTGTDYHESLAESVKNWPTAQNCSFEPVFLTSAEKERFYHGCSNEIIWPLFHSLPSRCQFGSAYWNSYCKVNDKFAEAVERVSQPDDFIWVHDYHLMMVAQALRSRGVRNPLAYFHHIPFPPLDIFETLPWRIEVLRALMRFNVIGFQTDRDRGNFVSCLRHFLPKVTVSRATERFFVRVSDECAAVGTYPISIDYEEFATEALGSSVGAAADAIRKGLLGTQILLGVDRLDYTKGIPERLTAFETLLEHNPELRGRVTLIQLVIPSREEITEYKQLKLRIETLVSKINGEFGNPAWVPIHYFYRCIARDELMAFYRVADVALVTPLKDGMNLVAKEFCASRVDNRGVLVLSEFAGAAQELHYGALLVNPHDTEGLAAAMHIGLSMEESEQRLRMEIMRSHIRSHDVFYWNRSFRTDSLLSEWNAEPIPPTHRSAVAAS